MAKRKAEPADYVRLVCDRLAAAGSPSAAGREAVYAACRAEVAAGHEDAAGRQRELDRLEKAIRRQEMQALHEEILDAK